jgi:2-methylaconitate cis-trans-isomerase PrpF
MFHNLPYFNNQLAHANSIRCMLVRSGTSRLLLLDGSEIRAGKAGHDQIRRIILGSDGHGGFGGMTSQDNKVALVWPADSDGSFRFKFLQVVAESGAVLPMECSNAASASALMAQLSGQDDARPVWKATNLSTGQKMELRPGSRERIAKTWNVRFLAEENSHKALQGLGSNASVRLNGKTVQITPVLLGNLFLFTEIAPDLLDKKLAAQIAREGMNAASKAGWVAPQDYHPKVIPFRLNANGERREVETASYYHGELHRSMPGSAAMALASFLEMRGGVSGGKRIEWNIRHTSGSFDVKLGIDTSEGTKKISWSEFSTPVRLLGWGVASLERSNLKN